MKILAWNCRGLANHRAVRALLEVQRWENPDVLFLSETHLSKAKAENLKQKVGCEKFAIHESDGRSGGLLMLWKKEVVVKPVNISQYYIDVVMGEEEEWHLTGIYGDPYHKEQTWEALRELKDSMSTLPWLMMDDFNEILLHHEKEGGRARSQSQLQDFQDALDDCGLFDMGYTRDIFTWHRGRIRERLDRGVINDQWREMFPNAELVNGEYLKFDHRPLSVRTESLQGHYQVSCTKRFEAKWLKEETVQEVVQTAWARASAQGQGGLLMSKLNQVQSELHEWDRKVLKKPVQRMKKLRRKLEELKKGEQTVEAVNAQKEILLQIELQLEQEEIYWVQRARANWLKHGDRNTNFFHRFASSRKKRNLVKGLVDDQGIFHEDIDTMGTMVKDYFGILFTREVLDVEDGVLNDMDRRVTNEMNQALLEPFTREEVKKALFSIGDLKAPSPDGLHAIFFKRFWKFVEDDPVEEVLGAINNATIPMGWNNTTIVMIPKVDEPEKTNIWGYQLWWELIGATASGT
ncbi:uncharacterized protein LOC110437330 [Sorghum bicolor]|uniref:uncharacterized protein LOC110437330 n=1 Tax=Sorghum bicolor TaxID=4558 RepID=UPI000B424A6E|nr:uncharacterized protein LOC110437330 [Sorghum bicolor]|eukprot:XP_021321426.1 uncharacterized protein LOC110437330 [Sorghum bicolor]